MNSSLNAPKLHLWKRDDYYQMAHAGLFKDHRVELIQGQVIEMSPMGNRHAIGLGLVADVLRDLFGSGYHIREQMPFIIDDFSETEPDVAVIIGQRRDYLTSHPNQAALLVEVSDSTLSYDKSIKGNLYAKAGIPDYWILNLVNRQLEVYRDPEPHSGSSSGYHYRSTTTYTQQQQVTPLALKNVYIPIVSFLP